VKTQKVQFELEKVFPEIFRPNRPPRRPYWLSHTVVGNSNYCSLGKIKAKNLDQHGFSRCVIAKHTNKI